MPRKHKGQLTMSGEWARHLRPLLQRAFWKAERQAEKRYVREEAETGPVVERGERTEDRQRPNRGNTD